jgi:hypothetical protein
MLTLEGFRWTLRLPCAHDPQSEVYTADGRERLKIELRPSLMRMVRVIERPRRLSGA